MDDTIGTGFWIYNDSRGVKVTMIFFRLFYFFWVGTISGVNTCWGFEVGASGDASPLSKEEEAKAEADEDDEASSVWSRGVPLVIVISCGFHEDFSWELVSDHSCKKL